ncbi:YcaO-like family protein [Xenorhabdus griffiniae]|uniref:YcaO-like family protein n=1 Tax=Xenorhabdus griffiniae TaxID=351672 RepID=A0ABY9XF45_9GAMM|nr:YcaO-like family protein [Xenorhabdus griffiniae]MBD1228892.1 YcaO-like family protein [Xenorhabdus griffiniae]MBE8588564.1 YcaO-like family protein [Xenorhabdus griffiniae]WMV71531.1 YcaO-like family protein [Xenorhabdus griffiniae]WNH01208.1 YcaO-like family protein [Xenorhabdus griffiniae]
MSNDNKTRAFLSAWFDNPLCQLPTVYREYGYSWPDGTLPSDYARMWLKSNISNTVLLHIAIAILNVSCFDGTARLLVGRGIDSNPDCALLKARAEAIERVGAFCRPAEEIHFASSRELKGHIHSSVANLLELRHETDNPRWWITCKNKIDDRQSFLPLEYVQIESLATVKEPLVFPDSTGMAVHSLYENAVQNGFHEALERAILKDIWRSGLPSVHMANVDIIGNELASYIEKLGGSIWLSHINLENACNFYLALFLGDGINSPALITGCGVDTSDQQARLHAINELYGQLVHSFEIWPKLVHEDKYKISSGFEANMMKEVAQETLKQLKFHDACKNNIGSFISSNVNKKNINDCFIIDRSTPLSELLGLQSVQCFLPANLPFCWKGGIKCLHPFS